MNKLNRRGPRESGLHRGLRRRYAAITASMAAEEDVSGVFCVCLWHHIFWVLSTASMAAAEDASAPL